MGLGLTPPLIQHNTRRVPPGYAGVSRHVRSFLPGQRLCSQWLLVSGTTMHCGRTDTRSLGCAVHVAGNDPSSQSHKTYTAVFRGTTTAAFVIASFTSSFWVTTLLCVALSQHVFYNGPAVWFSGVRDFGWYDRPHPSGSSVQDEPTHGPFVWIIGYPRGRGVHHGFVRPLSDFIFRHTPWRRVIGVEPVWLSLIRGTVGFSLLLGLFAYAIIQCIKLPLEESGGPLPVRTRGSTGQRLPTFSLEYTTTALVSDAYFRMVGA